MVDATFRQPIRQPMQINTRISIGIGCPPGAEHCVIKGEPDPSNGTIYATATLRNSAGKAIGEAKYEITEEFVLYVGQDIPEGMLSWFPRYSGGEMNDHQKKAEAQQRFQYLLQVFLCNHAYAHLVLQQLVDGKELRFRFFAKDITTVFKNTNAPPSDEDFIARAQKIVRKGHQQLLHELGSPHIALFYGITNEAAESFLDLLATQDLIKKHRKTGYKVPYGTGNTADYLSCIQLTKEGLAHKAAVHSQPCCFVAMPFKGLDETFSTITSAWQEVFGDAPLIRQDFDPDRGGGRLIDEKILRNIERSSLVIADLSLGTKEQEAYAAITDQGVRDGFVPLNPNVMFEVGYAVRCMQDGVSGTKEVLFLAQSPVHGFLQHRVFDLRNRNVIPYVPDDLEKLRQELVAFLQHFKQEKLPR